MSTDDVEAGGEASERNLRLIRELVERIQASRTRYVQAWTTRYVQASPSDHTPAPMRGARPDYVFVDEIQGDEVRWQVGVNADPAATRPTYEPIGTVSGRITSEELRDAPSPIDEVRAAYTRLGFTYRESCPCSWCAAERGGELGPVDEEWERQRAERRAEQAWAAEVNARAADPELQVEQLQVFQRAMAAERELDRWEQEHEDYVDVVLERISRGEKIPERPASLSWLYGPSDEGE